MHALKQFIKRLLPGWTLSWYHRIVARLAAIRYGHPSRELVVIGITGTKGKSTTSNIVWHLLTQAGYKVGLTGTINYRIGDEEWLSTNKMTMVGRFELQRLLRRMVDAGCDAVVLETTSEGIAQWRHLGVEYDIAGLTNLTPEHIDAHGSFENYKQAKMDLFRHTRKQSAKVLPRWSDAPLKKQFVFNADADHVDEFMSTAEGYDVNLVTYGERNDAVIAYGGVEEQLDGTHFQLGDVKMHIPLLGEWNARNASFAVAVCSALGLTLEQMQPWLEDVSQVPGRMEFVDEGQDFYAIVDYAYESVSLGNLYSFCRKLIGPEKKIITTASSTGGGRDVARRFTNGEVAGKMCDYVVVTDEDPYDDDPMEIMNEVARGVASTGKKEGEEYWIVPDRRDGIAKVVSLAQSGDVILLTSKGAEQKMCIAGGKKIDWDDRAVLREALKQIS